MKTFYIILILFVVFFFGAVLHEKDLSKNYKKYGDAKAWFYEIKAEDR